MTEENSRDNQRLALQIISGFFLIAGLITLFISGFWRLFPNSMEKINVDMILGFYAEEYTSNGKITKIYAVVEDEEGKYSTVILPKRFYESAHAVLDQSYDILDGILEAPELYFEVSGSRERLPDSAIGMYYDWFKANEYWIEYAGLPVADDLADIISPYAIKADYAGGIQIIWVYILCAIAGIFIILAITFLSISFVRRESNELKTPRVEDILETALEAGVFDDSDENDTITPDENDTPQGKEQPLE